jgi:hypothetical protein
MTKKLYSTAKWKRYLKSRQLSELKKLQRSRGRRRGRARRPHGRPENRLVARLQVPTNFSLIHNPEETIHFLREFSTLAINYNIKLDLTGVNGITTDAIAALVATIKALGSRRNVQGNLPQESGCTDILNQSGFFEHVKLKRPLAAPTQGKISRRESKQVEPGLARDLVHIASQALFGEPRRCQTAYRALIESMSNTHNHAAGREPKDTVKQTWYSTVYADVPRSRACYTFLDTGVGIFKSIRLRTLKKVYRTIGVSNNADILEEILEGKVGSSTGVPYRGKGLPSIYALLKRGGIKELIIIANTVYANVGAGEFRVLEIGFPGTLLYWET